MEAGYEDMEPIDEEVEEEGGRRDCKGWWTSTKERVCGRKNEMSVRERMFLTPWEKWRMYGRVPTKLLLTVGLVILTTVQIVVFNAQEGGLYRSTEASMGYWFMPEGYDNSVPGWPVYTRNETIETIIRASRNYFELNELAIDRYLYDCVSEAHSLNVSESGPATGTCSNASFAVSPTLQATVYSSLTSGGRLVKKKAVYLGSGSSGGLLEASSSFWDGLVLLEWHAVLQSVVPGGLLRACIRWDLTLRLDFSSRGAAVAHLSARPMGACHHLEGKLDATPALLILLNLGILGLALWLLILQVRAILRSVRLVRRVRSWAARLHHKKRPSTKPRPRPRAQPASGQLLSMAAAATRAKPSGAAPPPKDASTGAADMHSGDSSTGVLHSGAPPANSSASNLNLGRTKSLRGATTAVMHLPAWEELSIWEKARVVNVWYVIGAIGSALNVASAIMLLQEGAIFPPAPSGSAVVQGLACALQWVSLIRFLEHDRRFFSIVLTLRHAAPRVARFLLGVFPLFIAYDVFAVAVFAPRVERFKDFGAAAVTLFSLANGDIVRESFVSLTADFAGIGHAYLYTFVALFIYVVLNVTIAIVEESFFSTAQKSEELLNIQRRLTNALQPDHEMVSGAAGRTALDRHSLSLAHPPPGDDDHHHHQHHNLPEDLEDEDLDDDAANLLLHMIHSDSASENSHEHHDDEEDDDDNTPGERDSSTHQQGIDIPRRTSSKKVKFRSGSDSIARSGSIQHTDLHSVKLQHQFRHGSKGQHGVDVLFAAAELAHIPKE